MAKKVLYSIQRCDSTRGWTTLLDFKWMHRKGEALAALRMADTHYGGPPYRVVEHSPRTGVGKVIKEGGGRAKPTVR